MSSPQASAKATSLIYAGIVGPSADETHTQESSILLCECCMLKLVNDDASACRDYYGHTHADLELHATATTVVVESSPVYDDNRALACDGHPAGQIMAGEPFWIAHVFTDADQDKSASPPATGRSRVTPSGLRSRPGTQPPPNTTTSRTSPS